MKLPGLTFHGPDVDDPELVGLLATFHPEIGDR
jgi:hypothetical protein